MIIVALNEVQFPWWAWLLALIATGWVGDKLDDTLKRSARLDETLWERVERHPVRAALTQVGEVMRVSAILGGVGLFAWLGVATFMFLIGAPMMLQPAMLIIPLAMMYPLVWIVSLAARPGRNARARGAHRSHRGHDLRLEWAGPLKPVPEQYRTRARSATELATLALGEPFRWQVREWSPSMGGLNAATLFAAWTPSGTEEGLPSRVALPRPLFVVSSAMLEALGAEELAAVLFSLVKSREFGGLAPAANGDLDTVMAMHDPAPLLSALDAVRRSPVEPDYSLGEVILEHRPSGTRLPTTGSDAVISSNAVRVDAEWFIRDTSRIELLDRAERLAKAAGR